MPTPLRNRRLPEPVVHPPGVIGEPAQKWSDLPNLPGNSGVGGGLGEYPVLSPLYRTAALQDARVWVVLVVRNVRKRQSGHFLKYLSSVTPCASERSAILFATARRHTNIC